jgi:hypothetical protein
MPAAHTDLILAVLGEEWGFVGVLGVFALYGALVWFGLRTALRARSDYSFFLALGLTLTIALQIALIAGGVLDVLPLSGVVLPFLSYGRTAMVVNFAVFGALVALSRETGDPAAAPFRASTRAGMLLGAFGLVLVAKAAYVQVIRSDATLGRGALTMQADNVRRFQYNPRLLAIARTIPRGTIFRSQRAAARLQQLGRDRAASRSLSARRSDACPAEPPNDVASILSDPSAVHLLGDIRTRANWGARNSSYAERDFTVALQGYDDRATVVEVPGSGHGQANVLGPVRLP